MTTKITMDQNNLPEGLGYGAGALALLLWLATQIKALFRRDAVDDAEAKADEAKAKAAAATFQGANEFLEMARVSSAQMSRKLDEAMAQITALQEQIENMRRSHSIEIARLERHIVRLGGSLKDFSETHPGGFQ